MKMAVLLLVAGALGLAGCGDAYNRETEAQLKRKERFQKAREKATSQDHYAVVGQAIYGAVEKICDNGRAVYLYDQYGIGIVPDAKECAGI